MEYKIVLEPDPEDGGARLSVPNHKELKRGLLLSLLRDAGIARQQFGQRLEGR